MKLYSCKCPNCLANVTISRKAKEAKCEYCGQLFLVDGGNNDTASTPVTKDNRLTASMICASILTWISAICSAAFLCMGFGLLSLVLGIIVFKKKHASGLIGIISGGLILLIAFSAPFIAKKETGISPELTINESLLIDTDKYKNMNEKDIISILEAIPDVNEVAAVNSSNDINGGLKKKDGYYAAIFFSLSELHPQELGYEAVIEGGTKLGGCIELFRNDTDAEKRMDNLREGENLGAGGHGRLGSVVIRTSYVLTPTRQQEMADTIVEAINRYCTK